VLEYYIKVRKFGRFILEKFQRISVGSEPNNVDVLKQNIIPQQQRIEHTQDLKFIIVVFDSVEKTSKLQKKITSYIPWHTSWLGFGMPLVRLWTLQPRNINIC